MRYIFIMFLGLLADGFFTNAAKAAPSPQASYLQLGTRTKLVFPDNVHINIPPYQWYVFFKNDDKFCRFSLVDGSQALEKNKEGADISISGTLTVSSLMDPYSAREPIGTEFSGESVFLRLLTTQNTPVDLWCVARNCSVFSSDFKRGECRKQMSIEEMEKTLPLKQVIFHSLAQ